jgi:hypothetical protein
VLTFLNFLHKTKKAEGGDSKVASISDRKGLWGKVNFGDLLL